MRYCKQGKVDMIITKSVCRFARNTLDCLKYIRMLKELGVDVYFEEQGIHSTQPGAEFYITIYGSIAQSESENMSANIIWGKAQSAKEGNVAFHYKTFLGYRKGTDGKPEIDPEQAAVVRRIYERFLAGDSLATIADDLTADGIPTPAGKEKWHRERIASILTNERYKGDAIINKTFIVDCISKKVKVNNGERPKYYVENNHNGKKKVVWRCISRLDYGKKHCHNSPSVEESILQEAIMDAIMRTAKQNADVLRTLKLHIGMGLAATDVEDNSLDIQIRIAEIDAEFKAMLQTVETDTMDAFDEEKAGRLMNEKAELQKQLDRISETKQKRENTKSRLEEIFTILEGLNNHPMTYDDKIVRQIIECVVVESKERIKVVFVGGTEVTEPLG